MAWIELGHVEWERIEFRDLRQGDIFMMFEPDGTTVTDAKGNYAFLASGNPYQNELDVWQIDIDEEEVE